ncbi:MAG TPA: peptide ABC transporter substrate-binding protein [Tepidisphaeraceae bacterium]|nr:peptide ABC transporter substrate-binding protein [Tepidisphaeraceae bacterium]
MKLSRLILATFFTVGWASITLRAADKADFIFVNRGDIGTLDPNRMSWMQDIRIGYALWEGLYALDPDTLDPIPGAAEKIEQSEDNLTYTFHLRENGRWSNGDPVTVDNFIFAWKRMLEEPGDYTYLLFYIKGARAYSEAFEKDPKSAKWENVSVRAPDPRTLIVTLDNPTPFFPDICAFPPMFPLNQKTLEKFKHFDQATGRTTYDAAFATPPNLVTNGPFMLTRWQLKVGQTLTKNPYYWDKQHVVSNTIESLVFDDPLLALQRYERGDVDWLAETSGDIAAQLRDAGRKDVRIFPSFGTYFYSFNCQPTLPGGRKNPFADMRVRQALTMAIDKRPIVRNVTKLGEEITSLYVPPTFPTYKRPTGLAYDVAKSKQLLADAGYPDGKGFPTLKLIFNTEFNDHKLIAEIMSRQWKQKLNINIELDGLEIKQFQTRLHGKDYDIARASWYGDYNDVSTFTDKYRSDSLNNDSGWINADYDKLLDQALKETDAQKRLDLLSKAEQILVTEVPILPLYHYVNKYVMRDNVKGIPLNPRNMVVFKKVTAGR